MKLMPKGSSASATRSVTNARKRLTRFLQKLDKVPVQELERSAERLYPIIISKVPYKTGKLEGSVYVRVNKTRGRPSLVANASATSPSGYNYAGIQHENEDFNHPIKGEAHFVSGPFNEEVDDLKLRLKERLKV